MRKALKISIGANVSTVAGAPGMLGAPSIDAAEILGASVSVYGFILGSHLAIWVRNQPFLYGGFDHMPLTKIGN